MGLWLGLVLIEEVLFYLLTATVIVQGFVITGTPFYGGG
jgi:hypothetical protein